MYRRDDPRLRRTLDQFSHNVETATETAQEGLYSFSQHYINPCLSSIGGSLRFCTDSCFPAGDERRRRQRALSRGRAEVNFDFYDDWEDEENEALLGWGNSSDELGNLISSNNQPNRERAMNYGTRGKDPRTQRKSVGQGVASGENAITGSAYLGFLERLPWNMGRRALRYKPSAADLQEQPSATRSTHGEEGALTEQIEEDLRRHRKGKGKGHNRNRSWTANSGYTIDSLSSRSSRGDLLPSDEEDAVPLDDSFANMLERRSTGEDRGSGSPLRRGSKAGSRLSVRTLSSKSMSSQTSRDSHASKTRGRERTPEPPTIVELQAEEERIRREEESELARKREAAKRLAVKRGLSSGKSSNSERRPSSPKPEMTDLESKSPSINGAIPFPALDTSAPPAAPSTPGSEVNLDRRAMDEIDELETLEADPSHLPGSSSSLTDQPFAPAMLPNFARSPSPG